MQFLLDELTQLIERKEKSIKKKIKEKYNN